MIPSRISRGKFRRFRFNIFKYDPASSASVNKTNWKQDLLGFAVLALLILVLIGLWRAYGGGVDRIAPLDWPIKLIHVFAAK
ncbi:MAG TPA: hypothetical protein VL335_02805 [Candidatus Paceibacterota bacterium]|nr:hypothetical protein [Candidatus Paceibacterota bacterium]